MQIGLQLKILVAVSILHNYLFLAPLWSLRIVDEWSKLIFYNAQATLALHSFPENFSLKYKQAKMWRRNIQHALFWPHH